jgi:hypothetical protein
MCVVRFFSTHVMAVSSIAPLSSGPCSSQHQIAFFKSQDSPAYFGATEQRFYLCDATSYELF